MAREYGQAWLTSATSDDAVISAVVLAESLRLTKTVKRIGIITGENVSKENRMILRKAFDAFFLMDDSFRIEGIGKEDEAKLYAFSLRFFDKCVFIAPNSLVLENIDKLFDGKQDFKILDNENGLNDLTFFMYSPDLDLWECLRNNMTQNGKTFNGKYLKNWIDKQKGCQTSGCFPKNSIFKFSLESGSLQKQDTNVSVVQFVDGNGKNLADNIKLLEKLDLGLCEKLVVAKWLEIYNHGHVAGSEALKDTDVYYNEPIAIIGMSCRYPGANNLEEFWDLLYQGEEGVREPPAFRWTKEHSLRVSQHERKTNAGFLSTTVDEFDARFFGVSPKEAAFLDPQARLLHEVMWESLEDSGIDPLSLYGSHTGIFTGSWMNDYKDIVQASTEKDFFRTYMGNSIGAAAARLSFLLGLTGPSIATESGCSSAIVALDLAVKSLRSGESTLALAGGVNLLLHPFTSNIMDYVIAPDGRCKTFDVKADGFGRAEGCGVLVLKRMSDALRDRDNIWAIIRGSAVSQEGLSRSLGTPTVHCEALAMQLALEDANVEPERISFVETHGTGTSVGDPMEVAAISKAYNSASRATPLVIGSVKTNLGHTESCSGIAGIMKTVLAMQHELIPKHRNLDTLNPEIQLNLVPAKIPLEQIPWPKIKGQPRLAAVSSFGITGTDGHVIIQEAPDYELPKFTLELERPVHLLKISGKTNEALCDLVHRYREKIQGQIEKNTDCFANMAYTANVGRASFGHRAFIVAGNNEDALSAIEGLQTAEVNESSSEPRKICFLFTGQGSQYSGMSKLLYETSPVFRVHFDECDRILLKVYGLSIRQVIWESKDTSKELSRTIYSQTSIFCVEYCLFKLWESWGITPDFVLGHSLGEFSAAVAAGILDFSDALKLVAERSRLIDSLPMGSMLVVKADKDEVDKHMLEVKLDLDFAAENHAEQTVVAGDTENIHAFLKYLKGKGLKAIVLEATHAFHSRHMDPMLEQYRRIAETVSVRIRSDNNMKCRYVSGMEGKILENPSQEINADYWVRHTREKVSFIKACEALRRESCQDFLEVGPQPVLSSFVLTNNENTVLNCLPSLRRGTNDWQTILTSLGKLFNLGYNVDWKGFDRPYKRNKVSLPFHPFYRKSYWVESSGTNTSLIHPLLGYPITNASSLHMFQNDLNLRSIPYLKDHCIGNRVIFPGAGFIELSLTAGYCVANCVTDALDKPTRPICLENIKIDAPLELKEEKSCRLQVIVDLAENNDQQQEASQGFRVKVFHQNTSSEESGKWVAHASANFSSVPPLKDALKKYQPRKITEILETVEPVSSEDFYSRVDQTGLKFGESFKGATRIWHKKFGGNACESESYDDVVVEVKLPASADCSKYLIHPLVIDVMFQSGIMTRMRYATANTLRVPVKLSRFTVWRALEVEGNDSSDESVANPLLIHTWREDEKNFSLLMSHDLTPIALMEDFELVETTPRTIESILEQQTSAIPDAWEEVWKPLPGPETDLIELPKFDPPIFNDSKFQERIAEIDNFGPDDADVFDKIDRLIFLSSLNALYELGWCPKPGQIIDVHQFCQEHNILSSFCDLVHFYFNIFHEEHGILEFSAGANLWKVLRGAPSQEEMKMEMHSILDALKTSKIEVANVYECIAENLGKILTGEVPALSILFPTDPNKISADFYYQNHPAREVFKAKMTEYFTKFFSAARAMNPDNKGAFRVLEVGAGTGSLTTIVLESMQKAWSNDSFEYYYTDVSQGFFRKAEKKLEVFNANIKYAVFNIEENPLDQGIPQSYFDLVVASDVIHATRNLQESLIHLRQTLRPTGHLCFAETIVQDRGITSVFGLLSGYWNKEDRPYHCCVGENVWRRALAQSGFHEDSIGIMKTYKDTFACFTAEALDESVFLCKPPKRSVEEDMQKKWVIFTKPDNDALRNVAEMLDVCRNKVRMIYPSSTKDLSTEISEALKENVHGIIYGWGMDTQENEQQNISIPLLYIAQNILTKKKLPKLYVVTQGVHAVVESSLSINPSAATIFGMVKSLKNEVAELLVRYVDLEHYSPSRVKSEQILFEIAMTRETNRLQIAYRENVRYQPRLTQANLAGRNDQLAITQNRYHLVLPQSRMISDLTFEPLEQEDVSENEVEIAVKSFSLNFKDILTVIKPSAEFENLKSVGLDFSGKISKVGSKVTTFKVGDRVFGANFKETQLPSHLVLEAKNVLKVPDNMTCWEASTLPAVFATALHCLMNIAKMKAGETVLIHTGSGGVGLAAIQLAKHVGAKIITTAGNTRKRAYLKALGLEHVFHSRNSSFRDDIMRVTNGRGVDIVLNSITGPGLKEASLDVCAHNARFIEMSKLSIWTEEEVKTQRPDVFYAIVDLTVLEREVWSDLLTQMNEHLNNGSMKPIPYVKFDALYIRQAFQYFQKAKHIGKVVCVMPEVVSENGEIKANAPLFNEESTYLITGGLGGIGFEVCKWMIQKGATDLVLMGRSPPAPAIAKEIEKLNAQGYNVVIQQGDVSNLSHCRGVLDYIRDNMKPLRGIQHSAGVLRDNMIDKQTCESFSATFTPKVTGTWNLHNLTRDMPLEHFVCYSSIVALIGNLGQANHASANCFEDAFTHYRHSLGLCATTINWGQWAQVGCAKEANLPGIRPVSFQRMLNGLETSLRTQRTQTCFCEFESLSACLLSPTMKAYFDKRLLSNMADAGRKNVTLKTELLWEEMEAAVDKTEKIHVLSTHLKTILRLGLRLDPDEPINDDANLQDLGVDSLMLIELKNSIQNLMGSRVVVSATLLKGRNTVRELATALVDKLMDEDMEDSGISPEDLRNLLQEDCQLDESIQIPETERGILLQPASSLKTILVTGCTGQLGPYILAEICKSYNFVEKIICLVRASTGVSPVERLQKVLASMELSHAVDLAKIHCVPGDVAQPNFGMPVDEYAALCQSVDAVIHSAVKGDHVEPYKKYDSNNNGGDLRTVNVGGTVNVLKFAATKKTKHVYYASAYSSILGGNEENTLCDDWPEINQIEKIVEHRIPGYQTSKYVCEMLLKQASERGIPVKVFRFPWIMGDSQTGRVNYMSNHFILRLLSYLKLKAVPSIVMPALVFPVDTCASLSLHLFFNDQAPFEIFNIGHPAPEMETEFVQLAKDEFKVDVKVVEIQEFADMLTTDSPLESFKGLYTDVGRIIGLYNTNGIPGIQGFMNFPETFFQNKKLTKYLPNYSTNIDTTMNIIRKNLLYVKSKGFFEKFNL